MTGPTEGEGAGVGAGLGAGADGVGEDGVLLAVSFCPPPQPTTPMAAAKRTIDIFRFIMHPFSKRRVWLHLAIVKQTASSAIRMKRAPISNGETARTCFKKPEIRAFAMH